MKYTSVKDMQKSIRYQNDGTGRDSYVYVGNGGFTNSSKTIAIDPRITFQRSLREYDKDDNYQLRRSKRVKNHKRNISHALHSFTLLAKIEDGSKGLLIDKKKFDFTADDEKILKEASPAIAPTQAHKVVGSEGSSLRKFNALALRR